VSSTGTCEGNRTCSLRGWSIRRLWPCCKSPSPFFSLALCHVAIADQPQILALLRSVRSFRTLLPVSPSKYTLPSSLSLGPGSAQDRVGLLQETVALPFGSSRCARTRFNRTTVLISCRDTPVGMLACLAIFRPRKLCFYMNGSRRAVKASPSSSVLIRFKRRLFPSSHPS
jgi:hypothetical protein